MKKSILLLPIVIYVLSFSNLAFSETNKSNLVFHSHHFSSEECLSFTSDNIRANRETQDLKPILNNLLDRFSELGYPLARIDSIVKSASLIDIFLTDGPKAFGKQSFDDPGLTEISISNREINREIILESVNKALEQLTNSGYPFASISIIPNDIQLNEDSLTMNIQYSVNKGEFIRVNGVKFPGQLFPNSNFLTLESRIQRGDVFSAEVLKQGIGKLKRLENIQTVGDVSLRFSSPGIVDIIIPVEERSINSFSGMATINPGDGTPFGKAEISFGNIFGTGRKLHFGWSGLSENQQGIQVKYREPWLFLYPFHIDLGMTRKSEDTLETFTSYNAELSWNPDMHLSVGTDLNREVIVHTIENQEEKHINTMWIGGLLSIDYLDHNWNPTRGFQFSTKTSAGFRKLERENSSETVHREELSVRFAFPLKPSFIAYFKAESKHLTADRVNSTEMIRIGGLNTVRGYSEERFRALRSSWLNTEFRWRPNLESYYGIFADVGFIHQSNSQYSAQDKYLSSIGITSEFTSRAGRIGFALGLGAGESLQQSRLHFRIQTLF